MSAMSGTARPLRDCLQKAYEYLAEELIPHYYVDKLYEMEVFCEEDRSQLRDPKFDGLVKRREQAQLFLDILLRKEESGIQKFLDILNSAKDKQPQIYNALFPQSDHAAMVDVSLQFFGREREVKEVLEKLKSSNFVCVVGPAGIGKTSLVARVSQRYLEETDQESKRLWVRLGQTVSASASASYLYRYIRSAILTQSHEFKSNDNRDGVETVEDILSEIEEILDSGSLVIIDACENCHNEELNGAIQKFIKTLLASPRKIYVMATSQRTLAVALNSSSDPNYRLSPLQEDDALEMITVQSSYNPVECDPSLLKQLAQHCSCFPLALAIVRTLLQGGCAPQELLQRFELSHKSKFDTLSPEFSEADTSDLKNLTKALQCCFDVLKSRSPTAYKSMLALSVIPQAFDETAREALCSDKVFGLMKEHCFLQPAELLDKTRGDQMHSLIREFASEVRRESYSNPGELDENTKCSFIQHFSVRLQEIASRYRDNPMQSLKDFDCHIESFSLLLQAFTDEGWKSAVSQPQIIKCLYDAIVSESVGILLVYRIPHEKHISALEFLLNVVQKRRDEFDEMALVRINFGLGKTLKTTWEKDDMTKSLSHFEETKRLLSDMRGSDLNIRFMQADCLKAMGRVWGRLATGQREISEAKKLRRKSCMELQEGLDILDDLLSAIGKDREASVLTIGERDVKRKIASCRKEQAEAVMWQRPKEACPIFEEVLKYRLDLVGENHVSTAQALLSLGKCYTLQSTKKFTKPVDQRQRLLEESEQVLTRASKVTAACGIETGPIAGKIFFQIGLMYKDKFFLSRDRTSKLQFLDLEIENLEKSVDILKRHRRQHFLGKVYVHLGRARCDIRDFDKSEEAYRLAEEIYDQTNNGDYGQLYWFWSETYREKSQFAQELEMLRKSREYQTDKWKIDRLESRMEEITDSLALVSF
jgi:tetratricopeptide (TPR) repeat protein